MLPTLGATVQVQVEGTVNATILKQRMIPSLLKLGRRVIFQHDNRPKHTSKMASALLKKLGSKVMVWPSMSPDLNPMKHPCTILEESKVSHLYHLHLM